MKKYLLLCISVLLLGVASLSYAASLSPKTIDVVVAKLTVMMKSDPVRFETVITKFYSVMDQLPEKKLQSFVPLIKKVNVLVDSYNASIIGAKKEVVVPELTMISLKDLETLKQGLFFKGPVNPDLSIIEFSDFECPFCKRHSTAGTIVTVLKNYEGKINYAFAHFPLSFHPLAQKASEAYECAVSLGANAFDVETKLFAEKKPDSVSFEKVVSDMKIDMTKFKACVDGGDMVQKIKDQIAFASKFGVRGTPANVVVNNKTGKFILVSGAVPADSFNQAITQLLK